MHNICDECETVAHCSKNGCIPKVSYSDIVSDGGMDPRNQYDVKKQNKLTFKEKADIASSYFAEDFAVEKAIMAIEEAEELLLRKN